MDNMVTNNASASRKRKWFAGAFKRLLVYFAPFVFAIASITNGILYLIKYEGFYYYASGCINGSSLYTLAVILVLTKSMCKWYKTACVILMINRLFEIVYYYLFFNYEYEVISKTDFVYATLLFGTAAFIAWFLSKTFKKTCSLISRPYKRV